MRKINRKGQLPGGIAGPLIFMIFVLITIIFFAIFIYGFGIFTDALDEGIEDLGAVNGTLAAEQTFGAYDDALLPGLKMVSAAIIFGMIIGIFVFNYLIVKIHPGFFMLYVVVVLVTVIASVPISNAYEDLLTGQAFSETLLEFSIGTHIIIHLPFYVTIIGLLGLIFIFVKFNARENEFT